MEIQNYSFKNMTQSYNRNAKKTFASIITSCVAFILVYVSFAPFHFSFLFLSFSEFGHFSKWINVPVVEFSMLLIYQSNKLSYPAWNSGKRPQSPDTISQQQWLKVETKVIFTVTFHHLFIKPFWSQWMTLWKICQDIYSTVNY